MADINLKTATPDTSLPTTGFLFGADSQASASPSVYSTQTVATTLLGSTSLTGDTITTSQPVLNLAQTWNASGVTFTGLKFNATSTASAAASLLMDLQTDTVSQFSVGKTGIVKLQRGAVGAPTLTFGDSTTGFFSTGADKLAATVSNARALFLDANNASLGLGALGFLSTGTFNTALGCYAMGFASVSGANNIGIGYQPLVQATSTSYQVAIGGFALAALTTSAYQHVAIGWQAGTALNNTAQNNVLIGHAAGKALTTGSNNVLIGSATLPLSTKTTYSVCIGNSIFNNYADGDTVYNLNSIAIGSSIGTANLTGYENVYIGTGIATLSTSAYWCVGVGIQALENIGSGERCTAIGLSSLNRLTNGVGVTGLGMNAGIGGGNASKIVTTASYGTYLGYQAGPSTGTQRDYQTVVGANALGVDVANSITLGRLDATTFDVVFTGPAVIGAKDTAGVGFTVATLPTASAALKGATAFVTDATSPTYLGTLTGGGAVCCPVFCNGTAWVSC
jgi:hypothetical protein